MLGSYAGATALGGDGFLAAFFAGLAVVTLNQSLCDCFLDYGDVTAEMAMLLSFLKFGIVLSGILSESTICGRRLRWRRSSSSSSARYRWRPYCPAPT